MTKTSEQFENKPLVEINYQYNFGYYLHLFFWSFFIIVIFITIVVSHGKGLFLFPIPIFIVYDRILPYLQKVNVKIFTNEICINGVNFNIKHIEFMVIRRIRDSQERGVIFYKGNKIFTFIISSFLSPAQTLIDGNKVLNIINSIKMGSIPSNASFSIHQIDVKTRIITTFSVIILISILSIPLIFLSYLTDSY